MLHQQEFQSILRAVTNQVGDSLIFEFLFDFFRQTRADRQGPSEVSTRARCPPSATCSQSLTRFSGGERIPSDHVLVEFTHRTGCVAPRFYRFSRGVLVKGTIARRRPTADRVLPRVVVEEWGKPARSPNRSVKFPCTRCKGRPTSRTTPCVLFPPQPSGMVFRRPLKEN